MRIKQSDQITKFLNENGWFVLIMLIFSLFFFIVQNINNRFWMHDFEVYYSAVDSFIKGEQVYDVSYGLGSGFYKYSPFALLLFSPTFILPFYIAKTIHFIMLSGAFIMAIIISKNIVIKYLLTDWNAKYPNLLLFLFFTPLLPHFYTELHLGNINVLLLLIFLFSLYLIHTKKEISSGVLIAIGILIKPHFILFLPLLFFRKKFKSLTSSIISIAIGLILPTVFIGLQANLNLHHQWTQTMLNHNSSLISGQDTIFSWIYRLINQFGFTDVIFNEKLFCLIILILISLSYLFMLMINLKKEKVKAGSTSLKMQNFTFEFFLLLALIPNITKTDSEHFLLSIPLIVFLIIYLFKQKKDFIKKGIAIFVLLLYGMNIRELLGKDFSAWLTANGILGLANLLLILLCIYLYYFSNRIKNINSVNQSS